MHAPVASSGANLQRTRFGFISGNLTDASYGIGLGSFLPLNDIELDLVAFFQALVSIQLNRAVVHKHIGSIVPADKAITLCVVKPLDFSFVLSH
jgi:hypothetical protein